MPDGLRARAAAAQIAAGIALMLMAVAARTSLPLGPFYSLKVVACFAVVAVLVVGLVGNGSHPFDRFGAANQVTTIRALLVALVVGAVDETTSAAVAAGATGVGLAATIMDGVDGWLARRTRMSSRFGARFDMEVDALLILALAVLVWEHEKAGAWVVLSGLLRYGFLAAGWVAPTIRRPLPESRRRQTICVVQIAGLLIALWPPVMRPASELVSALALSVLVYSFAIDTWWLLSNRRQQMA
jgi:phosphatidylglycerophosphate synthase